MEYMESKMQEHYESGNAMHAELEKVTAERDALAAQVEVFGDKLSEVVALLDVDGMTAVQWLLDNCQEIESIINMEQEQHLAEIRAQAIQDFIQFMYSQDNCQLCNSSLDIASKYAESIR